MNPQKDFLKKEGSFHKSNHQTKSLVMKSNVATKRLPSSKVQVHYLVLDWFPEFGPSWLVQGFLIMFRCSRCWHYNDSDNIYLHMQLSTVYVSLESKLWGWNSGSCVWRCLEQQERIWRQWEVLAVSQNIKAEWTSETENLCSKLTS